MLTTTCNNSSSYARCYAITCISADNIWANGVRLCTQSIERHRIRDRHNRLARREQRICAFSCRAAHADRQIAILAVKGSAAEIEQDVEHTAVHSDIRPRQSRADLRPRRRRIKQRELYIAGGRERHTTLFEVALIGEGRG